jgi:secondary thiamine-phosphate synthase enzyme
MQSFSVNTSRRVELIDITDKVQAAVSKSGKDTGLATVFIPHTTAAVTINENADPSVRSDIIKELNKIVPFNDSYAHAEGNSAAHIKASLLGFSVMVLVEDGQLKLGTWQGIYFAEFDGPRSRKVWVKVI